MTRTTFPKFSERVFVVRAAWRRQIPLRVRVEAVREAADRSGTAIPVITSNSASPGEFSTQPSSMGGPPLRQVQLEMPESRVA